MQPNATHRSGQRGVLSTLDKNGFATFESHTGAVFTVHSWECTRDDDQPSEVLRAREHWAQWPAGCLTFKRNSKGEFSVLATRTAAQCSAKRNAHKAALLADALAKEERAA